MKEAIGIASEGAGPGAVLRHTTGECEIAKMAVATAARGRGFGDLRLELELEPTGRALPP